MIDLRSDTVTRPSEDMRQFMMRAEVGDDVFNEDPSINLLQDMAAEMTGKEKGLFVPSGTQGNQISVNAHTIPGTEVICDYNCHIFNYESGAAGMLSGVQLHPLTGKNGHPTREQVESAIRPRDDHYPQTGLICLENTHNKAGGTIFPISEIKRISDLARSRNIPLHLDGARLWNASVATGIPLKEYASYFDSMSLCFSKGLGAPVGSVVVGSRDFITRAHYYRKAYGGGMRQAGILAAACIYAIEHNIDRLGEDHQNAYMLAESLAGFKKIAVDLETVQTNIVIADFTGTGRTAADIIDELFRNGIATIAFGPYKIRFVTHMHISRSDIEVCKDLFMKIFK